MMACAIMFIVTPRNVDLMQYDLLVEYHMCNPEVACPWARHYFSVKLIWDIESNSHLSFTVNLKS